MENVKEWLNRLWKLHRKIEVEQEYITRLKSAVEISPLAESDGGKRQINPDKIQMTLERIEDAEKKLKDFKADFNVAFHQIQDAINTLSDRDAGKILTYRYIDFCSWDEISRIMYFSKPYLYKHHKAALEEIEKYIVMYS
jgi:DNA-directed RNA polymerase specialized sigma subunit